MSITSNEENQSALTNALTNPLSAAQSFFARRVQALAKEEDGMSTVEYALGTIAAAAFGALLYTVVTGGDITEALTGIIERALNTDV